MYENSNINENNVISVIVPVYNIADYLPKCIESILMQTYVNIQIILVDDGSTDDSGKICEKYADSDKRITVIHKENGGLVSARKAGLAVASGKYIGFVDGDDYIDETYYEELLHCLRNSDADFVHSGIISEKNTGHTEVYTTSGDRVIVDADDRVELIQKYILYHSANDKEYLATILCSKLFAANLIRECYKWVPDNQSFGEDVLAFCRCILKSRKFILLSMVGYHYLVRKDSISHMWTVDKFWQESNLYYGLCSIWKEYDCFKEMKDFMQNYLVIRMVECMNHIYEKGLGTVRYLAPENRALKKRRIVIYGAGKVGRDYISQMILDPEYNIIAWIDKKFEAKINNLCLPVTSIKELDFDIVLIAVKDEMTALQIRDQLLGFDIEERKLVWCAPEEDLWKH